MTELTLRNNFLPPATKDDSNKVVARAGKKKISEDLVRFQVVLTQDSLDRLDVVKERVNAATRAEVLRNALRVYAMIVDEISNGNEVLIKEKNGDIAKIRLVS